MTRETDQEFLNIWIPALISYTRWVLKKALESDIHKLYFLARDAGMCYRIADRIVKQEGIPLECRYLEGSRYAWRLAEYHLLGEDAVEKICTGGVSVTLRAILQRAGLSEKETVEIAKRIGKSRTLDSRLSYAEIMRLKPKLANCKELYEMIQRHSKEAYDPVIRYFRQEGLLDETEFGIVDSGWIGTTQQTLERLLGSAGYKGHLQGFYFGLYELPEGTDPSRYHTYYFAPYRDIEKKVRFSNCLFEAVCSATEGMTTGYREEAGRIVPVYETEKNPNFEKIERNIVLLERVLSDPQLVKKLERPFEKTERRLKRLMSEPSEVQVKRYGNYLFSDDLSDNGLQPVAAVLNREEIDNQHIIKRFLYMKGLLKIKFKDSAWPEGSIVRYGEQAGRYLWHCRMYKRLIYIRKWLRRNGK